MYWIVNLIILFDGGGRAMMNENEFEFSIHFDFVNNPGDIVPNFMDAPTILFQIYQNYLNEMSNSHFAAFYNYCLYRWKGDIEFLCVQSCLKWMHSTYLTDMIDSFQKKV